MKDLLIRIMEGKGIYEVADCKCNNLRNQIFYCMDEGETFFKSSCIKEPEDKIRELNLLSWINKKMEIDFCCHW